MKIKEIKDGIVKSITASNSANVELRELFAYFQTYGPISFDFVISKDSGLIVAKSKNFHFGSIITSGRNPKELDSNIKDAILTAFDVPSVYLQESNLKKVGDAKVAQYAIA